MSPPPPHQGVQLMTQGSAYRSCTLESGSLIVLPHVSQWLWNAPPSGVFVTLQKSARKDAVKRETRGAGSHALAESYTRRLKMNSTFVRGTWEAEISEQQSHHWKKTMESLCESVSFVHSVQEAHKKLL